MESVEKVVKTEQQPIHQPLHHHLKNWDGHGEKGQAIYEILFEQEQSFESSMDCVEGICSCCPGSMYYGI